MPRYNRMAYAAAPAICVGSNVAGLPCSFPAGGFSRTSVGRVVVVLSGADDGCWFMVPLIEMLCCHPRLFWPAGMPEGCLVMTVTTPLSLRSPPERGDPFLFFGGQLVVGEMRRLDDMHIPQHRVLQQVRPCQASFLRGQTDVVEGDVDRRDRRTRLMPHPRFLALVRNDASLCRQTVSYTHLRAHETRHDLVCRLLLEKKKRDEHSKQ